MALSLIHGEGEERSASVTSNSSTVRNKRWQMVRLELWSRAQNSGPAINTTAEYSNVYRAAQVIGGCLPRWLVDSATESNGPREESGRSRTLRREDGSSQYTTDGPTSRTGAEGCREPTYEQWFGLASGLRLGNDYGRALRGVRSLPFSVMLNRPERYSRAFWHLAARGYDLGSLRADIGLNRGDWKSREIKRRLWNSNRSGTRSRKS